MNITVTISTLGKFVERWRYLIFHFPNATPSTPRLIHPSIPCYPLNPSINFYLQHATSNSPIPTPPLNCIRLNLFTAMGHQPSSKSTYILTSLLFFSRQSFLPTSSFTFTFMYSPCHSCHDTFMSFFSSIKKPRIFPYTAQRFSE